jgi:SAM-dependent methyltransferase
LRFYAFNNEPEARNIIMTTLSLEEQRLKLSLYQKGFCAFYLMKTGIDLGLFEKINDSKDGISPEAIADQLGLHEPYTKIWCQTAYYMEILECHGNERFSLAPHMDTLLVDTSNPSYYGPWIDFTTTGMVKLLENHPKYYRKGLSEFYDDFDQGFSDSAKALGDQFIPLGYTYIFIPSIPGLKERMDEGMRVLDIGCGSGLLMTNLSKVFPKCSFVGVDVDKFAIKHAQKSIKENGLKERVSAHPFDVASLDYSSEFDLVNLSVSLHEINPEIRDRSIANCHKALRDSGQIVILEGDYPEKLEDFRKPEYTYIILEQFFEITFGSKLLSQSEKHQLLLDHGFKDPSTIPMPGGVLELTFANK